MFKKKISDYSIEFSYILIVSTVLVLLVVVILTVICIFITGKWEFFPAHNITVLKQ